ncbi:MAG: hypothetical protein C0594_14945 [Marinilabiliales bacterium]|nr:MAG: hypothetical protein C0594_14945 [Marinilabiliales bacterium]
MKNIGKTNLVILLAGLILLQFSSCVKREFDAPPIDNIPEGSIITIDSLRSMYQGADIVIDTVMSIYATVTADESTGNLYKTAFVQDTTAGLQLTYPYSGGLYQGDSVRISLEGCLLTSYGGAIQLELIHVDSNIVKQFPGQQIEPKLVTLPDLLTYEYEGQLIKLEDVEIASSELGQTWADADGKESRDITLTDCSSTQGVVIRTSGYAKFADEMLPGGKGSLIAVASQYNGAIQLTLRNLDEVMLDSNRCDGSSPNVVFFINKNFEDGSITSGGWVTKRVVGTTDWSITEFSGNSMAKVTNWNGSVNSESDVWLISPALDLSASNAPVLSFTNICNYTGANLELYISTSYDGTSLPDAANWTQVTFTLSSGSWAEQYSGDIDLSPYKVSSVYIGFRYQGSTSDGKTWELDDIKVMDN